MSCEEFLKMANSIFFQNIFSTYCPLSKQPMNFFIFHNTGVPFWFVQELCHATETHRTSRS